MAEGTTGLWWAPAACIGLVRAPVGVRFYGFGMHPVISFHDSLSLDPMRSQLYLDEKAIRNFSEEQLAEVWLEDFSYAERYIAVHHALHSQPAHTCHHTPGVSFWRGDQTRQMRS